MWITQFITAAFEALLANKLRSFLTMLGIVIGIAAIVIIVAVGNGAQSLVINQVNTFGSDLIGILPGSSDDEGPPAQAMGVTITTLKSSDIEAVRDRVPGVLAAAGYVRGAGTVSWENESVDTQFVGVSPEYQIVEDVEMALGHFFTDDDDRGLRQVTVLGWQVYKNLFGDRDPIGQRIRIKRQSFRIVGVAAERGTEAFQNQDDQLFIPLLTAQKRVLGIDYVSLARAKARPGHDLAAVAEAVKAVLRDEHNINPGEEDDFSVRNADQLLDILGNVTDILKYFLAAISALSLVVGGIGIMNIMLVSVLQRTREIGLRKAVGARPLDLRIQFLAETMIIALVGGLIGFALGLLVAYGVAAIARLLGYYWEYSVGITSVATAIFFPLLLGLVFGYYPAAKAAKLKPIQALHYE